LNNQPHKPTQQPNFAQETGCQGTLPMKMSPMSKAQHTLKINRISALLLCSLALVWGGAFFFGQIALEDVPSVTVALHRVGWAVPALWIVLCLKGIKMPRSPHVWICFFIMGALNNAIPFSLILWGQTLIGSSLAAILNGTTAVFGAVVAAIFLSDEPLTLRKIIGALCGLLGVAFIMGIEALTDFDPRNLGQLAVLTAGLSYAFAGVWAKRHLSTQPPILNAFGMLLGSTVLLTPIVFFIEGAPSVALAPKVWTSLIALSLVSTALAYLLYFEILRRAGSANLMLVTLLIPPVTIALSYTFLGERVEQEALYGLGLIALGLGVTDGRVLDLMSKRYRQFKNAI
jgi:drug/metabolite transporter (DMT)-like permease